MRWPLKAQIVVPLAAVTLATIAVLATYQARVAATQAQQRIASQIDGVTQVLAGSSYPLSPRVLEQMHHLSGAEFVVEMPSGLGAATLELSPEARQVLLDLPVDRGDDADRGEAPLDNAVTLDGVRFYHAMVARRTFGRRDRVHLLYSEETYREAVEAAVWPPVTLGLASMAVVIAAGWWVADRVTRSVAAIGGHVQRIAGGEFQTQSTSHRRDELGDLARGVNRMAEQLAGYENEVRRTEQLRTLGQLAAGIAHEIRNAATGARLALQHHQSNCPADADQLESLRIASQQLEHIEEYVQRFVRLGRDEPPAAREAANVAAIAAEAGRLAAPYAEHLGVELASPGANSDVLCQVEPEAVRQAIYNLIVNAIDAAAGGDAPQVSVAVAAFAEAVAVTVADNGRGPDPDVAERMFEPFATAKADGAGLGLALVQRVADEHNGSIGWRRVEGRTEFTLTLPHS